MPLYEISNDFATLFDRFEEFSNWEPDTDADGRPIDAEGNLIENVTAYKEALLTAWFDTLEGIKGEFDMKAESVACFIKNLKAEVEMIKNEERALKTRRENKERQFKRLNEYLISCLDKIGCTKIETSKAVVSIRNNAESLVIDDEISFIKWLQENNDELLKYSMPEIRKAEVKKLYKTGVQFPFVHTERSRSLIIK